MSEESEPSEALENPTVPTELEQIQWPEFKEEWKARYLTEYARFRAVSTAARAAGVDRSTIYAHRETDPLFVECEREAERIFIDRARNAVVTRGVDGWLEPVFQSGKLVGHVRRFDSKLLIRLLERYDPEWRTKYDVNVSGQVTLKTESEVDSALAEALEELNSLNGSAAVNKEPGLREQAPAIEAGERADTP